MTETWRGFDRATLDREYSPSSCVGSLAPFLDAYAQRSVAARAALAWRELRYGAGPAETLDFFPAREPDAPLHLFIHGGYWTELSKRESSFAAPGFIAAGAAFAALDYALAPSVTLDAIVGQIRAAIAFLHAQAPSLGVDRARLHLSGSSAGAHLVAMALATDWTAWGMPARPVRGAVLLSGVFDLAPIRHSYVNDWLALDEAAVARNSPVALKPPPEGTALLAAVGENETGEFKRQTTLYAAHCLAAGRNCPVLEVAGRNHFDIVFDLADPATPLGRRVRAQMGPG